MTSFKCILYLAFIAGFSCRDHNKTTAETNPANTGERNFDFIWNAKQVDKKQVPELLHNIHDSLSFEVTNLYPEMDSIPQDDFLALDDALISRGFKVIDWGRGNWEKGPRLISLHLESNAYICRLDKLYYVDSTQPHHYKVTERAAFLMK